MSHTTEAADVDVPLEEQERRVAEYRRQGYERRAMPHVIYHAGQVGCPWPGCGFQLAGIDFQLEKYPDPALCARCLAAWWQGLGLVGKCPGCKRLVLFTMEGKRAVDEAEATSYVLLPDDWFEKAYVL